MALQALVTGANRGIGLALTQALLARGDRVIATCRTPGHAAELNRLAAEHPGALKLAPLDIAEAASRHALVAELPLLLGEDGRVDVLIQNAGVLHSGERFGKMDEAVLRDSLAVNCTGPFLLTQALAPWLADGAKVGNLSSILGSIADTTAFSTPSYRVSKAAQNMSTRLLAAALAERGITVLALHPGWVQTDMGGDGANVTVAESAAGLLKVISESKPSDNGSFFDWRGRTVAW